MRDKDGNYIAEKFINFCGTVLRGVGKTKEDARFDLKTKLKQYREAMKAGSYLVETGETRTSPGFEFYRNDTGAVKMQFNADRQVKIMARPDLARYIQNDRSNK